MLSNRRALAAVAALLACAAAARAGDLVQKKDGSFVPASKNSPPQGSDFDASNWTVIDADIDSVTYQIVLNNRPVTSKLPAADILDVWLEKSRQPAGWKEAGDLLEAGEWVRAAQAFRAIGDAKAGNAVARQKALLKAAQALGNAGSAETEGAYRYVLQAFPKSFYTRTVWRELAGYFMDRGDNDKAMAAIAAFEGLPGLSEADKIESRYMKTLVAFRKAASGKDQPGIQKCLDEFKSIAQAASGNKDLAPVNALARLGQGRCMLELGNFKDAKALFADLSENAKENSLAAGAFNGLGECWFRQSTAEGFVEARLCFLRTVTMYADGAAPDDVARALCFAGECFSRIQDEEWRANAVRELTECARRFPNSPWAARAKQLLQNLPK